MRIKKFLAALAIACLAGVGAGWPTTTAHAANTPDNCDGVWHTGDSVQSYATGQGGTQYQYIAQAQYNAAPAAGGCYVLIEIHFYFTEYVSGSVWACGKTYRSDRNWSPEGCYGYPFGPSTWFNYEWGANFPWSNNRTDEFIANKVGFGGCSGPHAIWQLAGGPQQGLPIQLCAW